MIQNVTLLLLHLTSLSSTSALFSPATLSQRSFYNFQNIYMSKHYSTFLYFSVNHASSIISNSKFTYFLNSVVNIHQDDQIPQYDGISDQNNNPISPRVSFVCNNTLFQKNTSPFNGAAILVHSNINSINSINAIIENTDFNQNKALMGGAIYYESTSINMTDCHFTSNSANIGSHIFLSCTSSTIEKCSFQESYGSNISSLELTSSESPGIYNFINCKFFLNKSPFRANGGSNAILNNSCFLNYYDGQYFEYNYANIISVPQGKVTLNGGTVNDISIKQEIIETTNPPFSKPPENGAASSDQLAICRLIPYPTQTSHYKINSEPAIFALVAIIFFVLVSIIGIFIVTCKKKKDIPPEDAVNEPLRAKS